MKLILMFSCLMVMCSCATVKPSGPAMLDCVKAPAAQAAHAALDAALGKDVAEVERVAASYAEDVVNCVMAELEADLSKSLAMSVNQSGIVASPAQHKLMVLRAFRAAHPEVK